MEAISDMSPLSRHQFWIGRNGRPFVMMRVKVVIIAWSFRPIVRRVIDGELLGTIIITVCGIVKDVVSRPAPGPEEEKKIVGNRASSRILQHVLESGRVVK